MQCSILCTVLSAHRSNATETSAAPRSSLAVLSAAHRSTCVCSDKQFIVIYATTKVIEGGGEKKDGQSINYIALLGIARST